MILNLKKIFADQDGFLSFDYEMNLSATKVGNSYPFVSPVRVKGTVASRDGFAQLEGTATFDFSIPCDRCARQTDKHYDQTFSHILVLSLENEEDDRYVEIHNDQLELDTLVREDILLALPTKFLCKKDCKGLCPKCGKNLNDGPCGCSAKETDPRLDVLKNLIH